MDIKRLKFAFQYGFGVGLGAGLMYLAFRGVNWDELKDVLSEVRYEWMFVALVLTLVSHFVRAYRWKMLIEAAGHRVPAFHAFWALCVGYMTNNAVPRLGEVTRCSVLVKSDRVPLTVNAGTVVTERALDMICLGLLFGGVFIFEVDKLSYFFQGQAGGDATLIFGLGKWAVLDIVAAVGIVGLVVMAVFHKKLMRIGLYAKVFGFVRNIVTAALSIRNVRNWPLFLFLTVFLWFLYAFTLYLYFNTLPATTGYSFYLAVILMSASTIGMVAPSPGGVGAYHYFMSKTMELYGADQVSANAMALLAHTPQFILNIVLGAIGYFYLILKTPPPAPDDQPEGEAATA